MRQTRTQHSRKASRQEKQKAGAEVRRLTKLIARLLKQQRHVEREDTRSRLAKAASSRDAATAAKIIKTFQRQAAEADIKGEALDPTAFTEFFTDKPQPEESVPLQHFELDEGFRETLRLAIRKAKKGKAPGPDRLAPR